MIKETGEGTNSSEFDFSTQFILGMLRNLDQALDHPDMTPELAEILSIPSVKLEYGVETGVRDR